MATELVMPRNIKSSGSHACGMWVPARLIRAANSPEFSATPMASMTTRITASTPLPNASQFLSNALSKIQRTCSDWYIGRIW